MPVIPNYQQRTRSSSAGVTQPVARNTPNAMGDVGQIVSQIGENVTRAAQAETAVWAADKLSGLQSKWQTEYLTRSQNAEAGAPEFTGTLLKDFDTDVAENLKTAPNAMAKRYIQERSNAFRDNLTSQSMRFEAESRVNHSVNTAETALNRYRNEVITNPSVFDARVSEFSTLVGAMNIPADKKEAILSRAPSAMASDAVTGLIDTASDSESLNQIEDRLKKQSDSATLALDPDDRARFLSAVNSKKERLKAEHERNLRELQSEYRQQLATDVQDAFAARQMGIPAVLPSKSKFIAAYGSDGAERYNAAAGQWKSYDVAGIAATMPPSQALEYMASLKPTSQAGAANAAESYELAVKLYAQQRDRLEKDPVNTLLSTDPQLAALQQQSQDNPETLGAYISKLYAKQQALGIAEPKLLSDAQRSGMAQKMDFDPAKPRARADFISQLKSAYGDYYPAIMREVAPKLEGQARVMIDMQPEQSVRLDAATAQQKELNDLVKGPDATDINNQLDIEFESLAVTLADNVDAASRLAEFRNSAELLAKADVLRGTPPQEAARKAAAAVVNDQYNYVDSMRIPVAYDAGLVSRGANLVQQELSKTGNFAIAAGTRSDSAAAQADLRSVIQRQGYWVTNESGTGMVLRIPHRTGMGDVYTTDGKRVEKTWDQFIRTEGADKKTSPFVPTDPELR